MAEDILQLSQRLGALTLGWVVSLLQCELTPHHSLQRSTMSIALEFDKVPRDFSPPKHPISALLYRLSRSELNYGSFREEPAISSLDWPFTPIPRSEERFARQNPFRLPSLWREISPCPGIDRLVSGLKTVTPGAFTPRPLQKAADLLVSLQHRSFNFLVSPLL